MKIHQKNSTKNLQEYIDYVNRMAEKSLLHKTEFKNKG
jgi:hypothetical protein